MLTISNIIKYNCTISLYKFGTHMYCETVTNNQIKKCTYCLNNNICLGVYWGSPRCSAYGIYITIVAANPPMRESCHMAYRAIIFSIWCPTSSPWCFNFVTSPIWCPTQCHTPSFWHVSQGRIQDFDMGGAKYLWWPRPVISKPRPF